MKENKKIKEAKKELEYLTGDEEIRRLAELREKAIRDEVTNINDARRKGIEEGEKKEKLEIAKRMKKEGIDIQIIEKLTDLIKEEIEKL